ncbi:glycosyltransferase family 4 protein, partial [Thermodesulfobacteriota bacterium]
YPFAKAISDFGELHLVVLLEEGHLKIPDDLRDKCTLILQPPNGFRRSLTKKSNSSRIENIARAFARILTPWAEGGRSLLQAGSSNCLSRSEKPSHDNSIIKLAHLFYALILQSEIALGTKVFRLPPARTMERYYEFNAILPEIKKQAGQRGIDVIWIEHSYLFPYVEHLQNLFPNASLVCNAHNVEYSLHERLSSIVRTKRARYWYKIQAEACQKMEKNGFSKCNLIFCCSDNDKKLIQDVAPHVHIEVIPNGVDTVSFSRNRDSGKTENEPLLLFTGGFGYAPNRDAVWYFLKEIFPLIRSQIANCRFCIAGSGAQTYFGHLPETDPHIDIASDVPDMRPFFDKATLVVVPLRAGSGTRIKILEAMAMGRAVVSTSLGAEGIDAKPEKHFIIADSPDLFAKKVTYLLQNHKHRIAMENEARQLVLEKFDWEHLSEKIKKTLTIRLSLNENQIC